MMDKKYLEMPLWRTIDRIYEEYQPKEAWESLRPFFDPEAEYKTETKVAVIFTCMLAKLELCDWSERM